MNEYTRTFTGGAELYVEEIFAKLDPHAIEMAEAAAARLCEGDWTEAVLLDNEGPKSGAKISCPNRSFSPRSGSSFYSPPFTVPEVKSYESSEDVRARRPDPRAR